LAALVRKPRDDRGARRAVSATIKDVIEGLALQRPPLPIAARSPSPKTVYAK
jgi:putative transposase